jgi:uncharacterized protein
LGNPPKPPEMAAPEPGDALQALIRAAASEAGETSRLPPVERWNPPYCGDIGLAIRRDGVWLYQNSPIGRMAIVKLFARVLRKDEDGRTFLVTPAEKVDVAVEDAPFLAVELAVTGEGPEQLLTFRTNVDDVVSVGPEHPLRFEVEAPSGGLKPYVRVRGRLDALVTRAVYAELAALAVPHTGREAREASPDQLGLWSGGVWWPLA